MEKKFTSFCQAIKKKHGKENRFFFLPHGVESREHVRFKWTPKTVYAARWIPDKIRE